MTYLMDERMSVFFEYIKQNFKEDNQHKKVMLAFIALTSQMSLFTNCTCTTETLNYYYENNFKKAEIKMFISVIYLNDKDYKINVLTAT